MMRRRAWAASLPGIQLPWTSARDAILFLPLAPISGGMKEFAEVCRGGRANSLVVEERVPSVALRGVVTD